ncbi:MAG: polyribonucleotide nucleotidyltransferase [Desulfonatronovibrionaceae bacterium]
MTFSFNIHKVTAEAGSSNIELETGKLALQADGSVQARYGDTVVLITAVTQPVERDINFMPLVVNYQEMSYASGNIPGNYFRREIGRPSERETLISRLIDRPIRPLFPDGFRDEVQVIATVLSSEPDFDPDILALTGASTALHISRIPFLGPIAGARIGYINDKFVFNPTCSELEESKLDIIMAAAREGVVMVEGGARFIPESMLADAISWGHERILPSLDAQEELRRQCGAKKLEFETPQSDPEVEEFIREFASRDLAESLEVPEKMRRKEAKAKVREETVARAAEKFGEESTKLALVKTAFEELEKTIVREKVASTSTRIDGRGLNEVRPLCMETGVLPRTHGSSIFARGETKALCIATLGSSSDEQRIETLAGDSSKRFMLHYNFPPYCVGEVKMMRGPSRREIGHGALAERALQPILPDAEEFPFTMRIVSEVMESNGSSSMASVCGGSLALMDAGIPVKDAVAGIAMGLVKEQDEYRILTDILGDEDHLGDMDFKVAGTKDGVTAIQMDIKISGIPADVMRSALEQAKEAKLHILNQMDKVLSRPRSELSPYAPKMEIIQVDTDKIKDVIGPSGKNIKAITSETGASVDIEDSGKISIFAPSGEALEKTKEMILVFNQKPELGKDYTGQVKKILDFGAVVEILPGVEGLVHISQLDIDHVNSVSDVANIGDEMKVKVIELGDNGKVRLSRMAVLKEERGETFNIEDALPGGGKKRGPGGGGDRSRRPNRR